jgi:hypothetical protein
MTELDWETLYPDQNTKNGNYPKGMLILVEETDWDGGPYTIDIVIAQRDFNYSDEWDRWEKETGKKRRSYKLFFEWLLNEGVIKSVDYMVMEII